MSIGDDTLVSPMIDDFPAFGVVGSVTDRFVQDVTQFPASPDIFAKNGTETERIEWVHEDGLMPATCAKRMR